MSSDQENPDGNRGAGLVVESRDWYRDQYRRVLLGGLILLGLLGVSLMLNILQWATDQHPVYFAVSPDLKIQRMTPLSEPHLTQAGLLNWTTRVVTETLSLNFLDWRRSLMKVRPDYTDHAYVELLNALRTSGNLDAIRQRRLSVAAVVTQSPVVTAQGVVKGVHSWRVEFPVKLSYEDSDGVVSTQDLLAKVMVQRADLNKRPRGVHIARFTLSSRSGGL